MITDNYVPDQYVWNGVIPYEVNFPFGETTDLEVTHIYTVNTVMILDTDYTVTFSNGEWFVTPMADWIGGDILIKRKTPKTQTWQVSLSPTISRKVLEATFDKVVKMVQDLYYRIQALPVYTWIGTVLRITDPDGTVVDSPDLKGSDAIDWDAGPYGDGALVWHNLILWVSNVPNNMEEPGTGSQWDELETGGGSSVDGTLGATIAANKLVYFDTDGKVYVCDNTILMKSFSAGFTTIAGVLDDIVEIQKAGYLAGFTGLTAGIDYYGSTSGDIQTRGAI
ncbi:MAG: hypothetical protein JRC86_11345, partial [Deltaproteobacteria bacterium]|nr:hypothetical protein [Deltaproteobacteria bacterium]